MLALHMRRNSKDKSLKTMIAHEFALRVQTFVEEGGKIICPQMIKMHSNMLKKIGINQQQV